MSTKKINELTAATTIASEDILPIVVNPSDNPATRKASVSQLFAAVTIDASQITAGEIADARLPATITRDTELATGLATKENVGTAAAAVAAHEAASDPHPQYATDTDLVAGLATKANTVHGHSIADITNLQTTLDGKAAVNHTQTIDTITNLQTTLDGKQASLGYVPINPANNLSDLASTTTARTNLGLGTAAVANTGDFAAAAQGVLADTALQPGAIGSTIQPYDADLLTIAGLTPTAGQALIRGASAWEARTLTAADIPNLDANKIASGTLADSVIPSGIARDSEVSTAISTHAAGTDVHAISSVTGLQTALDGKQPLDSDLTAIAALTTTSYGRNLLTQADAAALRSAAGVAIGSDVQAYNARLAEVGSLFAAAPNGSTLRKRDDGTGLEFAVPRSRILYRWGGSETITGTTTETTFVNGAYTILANTFSASSTIEIHFLFENNNTANTKIFRLKIGTNTVAQVNATTTISFFSQRQIFLTSLTAQLSQGAAANVPGGSFAAAQSLSIDFATAQSLSFTGLLASTGDSLTLRYVELREIR